MSNKNKSLTKKSVKELKSDNSSYNEELVKKLKLLQDEWLNTTLKITEYKSKIKPLETKIDEMVVKMHDLCERIFKNQNKNDIKVSVKKTKSKEINKNIILDNDVDNNKKSTKTKVAKIKNETKKSDTKKYDTKKSETKKSDTKKSDTKKSDTKKSNPKKTKKVTKKTESNVTDKKNKRNKY